MTATIPVQRLAKTFNPDEALDVWAVVQRVQQGDTAAYGHLYSRYRESIYRFVHYRIRNHAITEDITSMVFERGLRNIGKFTWQGRDFGAWLTTIARNLTVDHHKSGFYRFECPAFDEVIAREDVDESPGAEDTVVAEDQHQAVLAAMEKLTPDQRWVLTLRCLKELSVREVAAIVGKDEGAVKAAHYRAVQSMRLLLGPGFDPRLPAARPMR